MADNAAMSRWIRMWLRGWRSEPLVLVSPLPVETVRTRLAEGSTTYSRAFFGLGGGGGYVVLGHVGTHRVSLEAARVGLRNSWRPTMRGRLEPDGTGSRLVGHLGWAPFIKALSTVWLTGVGFFLLVSVSRAVDLTWSGDVTGEAFLICLAPLGMLLFFVGLTTWGTRVGLRDETYLRSWLAKRLQTADTEIPGYRPWRGEPGEDGESLHRRA